MNFDQYCETLKQKLNDLKEKGKLTEKEVEGCFNLAVRYRKQKDSGNVSLDWSKVQLPNKDAMISYNDLSDTIDMTPEEIQKMLGKVAMVKLNGGLGTSMGCSGPKTSITIKEGKSFLELIVDQLSYLNKTYSVSIPLVIMNSFNTEKQTKELLVKIHANEKVENIICFNQDHFPRFDSETMLPLDETKISIDDPNYYYPPGHGDILRIIRSNGIAKQLQEKGIEYIMISNGDNLGATLDLKIVKFLINDQLEVLKRTEKLDVLSEQTEKTKLDVKGGTLIKYEGRIKLLETAQVPKDHMDEFCSVDRFKTFNCNNIWIRIDSLLSNAETEKLDIIVNPKTIGEKKDIKVTQLEVAVGASIGSFTNGLGIIVPRTRFIPVKKCSDLMLVSSDLYDMGKNYCVWLREEFVGKELPKITLENGLELMGSYEKTIKSVPSLRKVRSLRIVGSDHLKIEGTEQWSGDVNIE